ncbi:predicted protein [Nematostella vectensis]|uniref:Uncharacterized protein n=1 Tax=Nematostella vectensis TaxID=45351 RepID=A7SEX4_NEMVE|nr:predicted protein [Nematostella vectensis]|eukprot:XP_001629795.1 predicted protein [Nematostella vectensis]
MPTCGHSCCSTCAKRVNRKCPECREEFGVTADIREKISLKRMIRRLQAECKSCQLNGELGFVIDLLCPERETECTNASRNFKVKRLIFLDDADEDRNHIFTADGLIKEGQMFGKRESLKDLESYVEGPQKTFKIKMIIEHIAYSVTI